MLKFFKKDWLITFVFALVVFSILAVVWSIPSQAFASTSYLEDFDSAVAGASVDSISGWYLVPYGSGGAQVRISTTTVITLPNSVGFSGSGSFSKNFGYSFASSTYGTYGAWIYDGAAGGISFGLASTSISSSASGQISYDPNSQDFLTTNLGCVDTLSSAETFLPNAWNSVYVSWYETTALFFMNGTYVGSFECTQNVGSIVSRIHFNRQSSGSGVGFYLDDVALTFSQDPWESSASRIVSLVEPQSGSVTSSTTVDFSVDLYLGTPEAYEICISYVVMLGGAGRLCDTYDHQVGFFNFSTSTLFVQGQQVYWRAILYGEGNIIVDQTPSFGFSVGETQFQPWESSVGLASSSTTTVGELTLECNFAGPLGIGYSLNSICNFVLGLFRPDAPALNPYTNSLELLSTKFPFSWFYSVQSNLYQISTTTSNGMATLSLDLTSTSIPITINILSTTSVSQFLPDPARNFLRTIIAASLWLLFISMILVSVHRIFERARGA